VKNLVCPHCQTVVDSKASVCLGCGAEVVRGASQREKTTAGCLFTAIGVVITMVVMGFILQSVGARNEYGLAFVMGLLAAALIFNLIGRALVGVLFRSRLRFFRTYRHQ
jgi:uncharacterized integral membrane protein